MGGFPAQHGFQLFLAGDQDGRVTRPARRKLPRDFSAGDALGGFDDFQNGITATVANVEGFPSDALNFLKRAQVGVGDIQDVNIVADAGAIGRGIIGAKDINMGDGATGGIQDSRESDAFRHDALRRAAAMRRRH